MVVDFQLQNQDMIVTGNCIVDENGDGICDEIYGCTDPIAPNYVQEANIDDESCEEVIWLYKYIR